MTKILIVDDEPDFIFTLKTRLEFEGFNVLEAVDGEEGLARARQDKPDVILLDIMMPKIDGYEFCKILKGDPKTASLPVIMVTARTKKTNKRFYADVLAGACEAYIEKPFDFAELLDTIKKILDARL